MSNYIFLDIETTGLNPDVDSIIEIGAILVRNGEIAERYSTLLHFEGKIPLRIKNLTGITEEMLAGAPRLGDIEDEFLEFLGNHPIVGHNINFDVNFINQKLGLKLENVLIDTFDLAQFILPRAVSYRLETLTELLGVKGGVSHRALDDAESAYRVFYRCLDLIYKLNSEVLTEVYNLCEGLDFTTARFISEVVRDNLKKFPSGKTELPYAFMRTAQTGPDLFDDYGRSLGAVPAVDVNKLGSLLEPSGIFEVKNPRYKFRPGQVDMLETVVKGFGENRHMVIEAGTGTGKSLAYLIPAVGWALSRSTRVVIATHTINLQEQLWKKEIPELRETAGLDFRPALVKGRNNYLCLRRWENKLRDYKINDRLELLFVLKVLIWLTTTESGDKAELNISPQCGEMWSGISSDVDACLGPACRWFSRQCFVTRARRQADSADILVVNHSLLLADIKTENRILPAYDYLIIDEAHHLEDSATEQLGCTLSLTAMRSGAISLNRGFGGGHGPGLLNMLKKVFNSFADMFSVEERSKFDQSVNDAFDKVKLIVDAVDTLEDFLREWVKAQSGSGQEDMLSTVRVQTWHRQDPSWAVLDSQIHNLITRNVSLANSLKKMTTYLETIAQEHDKNVQSVLKDLESVVNYYAVINADLRDFAGGSPDNVYWIESGGGVKNDISLKFAPVSVSKLLHDSLFGVKKSILLTSATLSVDGTFEHFIERTGLIFCPPQDVIARFYDSPFSYERQAMLCVVKDLPEPSQLEGGSFVEEMTPVIADLAKVFNGRTMILFNSHKMLREVYARLEPVLEKAGIGLLGHKIDGGRTKIIEEFRQNKRTVLMGAASFWEGIDLPGEILKCVIIARLPFSPPTTPVVEARMEELVSKNKDAFYNYAVPEAVIKLKQGFGRLIRTEDDEGIVVVLDRRMVDRKYGRKFLNSLPLKSHFKGDTPTVLQKINDWMQGERPDFPSLNIIENITDIDKFLFRHRKGPK